MTDSLDFILSSAQEQRTSSWHNDRTGKFTSSQVFKLMGKPRTKGAEWTDTALTYIYERAVERMTGQPFSTFDGSMATEWGNDNEDPARSLYERKMDTLVTEGGFCAFNEYLGGSPDGYVGSDGLIEIKCPWNSTNHLKFGFAQFIKEDYIYQVQCNLIVTRRKWCDFISYDPRMPKEARIFIGRIYPDPNLQAKILEKVSAADALCTDIVTKLTAQ